METEGAGRGTRKMQSKHSGWLLWAAMVMITASGLGPGFRTKEQTGNKTGAAGTQGQALRF